MGRGDANGSSGRGGMEVCVVGQQFGFPYFRKKLEFGMSSFLLVVLKMARVCKSSSDAI